jgi:hypothetical protein
LAGGGVPVDVSLGVGVMVMVTIEPPGAVEVEVCKEVPGRDDIFGVDTGEGVVETDESEPVEEEERGDVEDELGLELLFGGGEVVLELEEGGGEVVEELFVVEVVELVGGGSSCLDEEEDEEVEDVEVE